MGSRWTWRLLALPGVLWLTVFFLLAFYAVVAVAFGNQNTLSEPVPFWNPLDWNVGYMLATLENIGQGEQFLTVFVRTFVFVGIALIVAFWDTHRELVAMLVAAFFLALTVAVAVRLRRAVSIKPQPFRSTLEALGRDVEALRSRE